MKIKYLIFCLMLTVLGSACTEEEFVSVPKEQEVAMLSGSLKVLQRTALETTLTFDYYPTKGTAKGEMLEMPFWGFGKVLTRNKNIQLEELNREFIPGNQNEPYSLLVLVDKSLTLYNIEDNEEYVADIRHFQRTLINFYNSAQGYEIALGGIATENNYTNGLKVLGGGFKSNINAIDMQEIGQLFDMKNDAGKLGTVANLNLAIQYISEHGRYKNKAILYLAKFGEDLKIFEINDLAKKARDKNVKVCTYSHGFTSHTEFALSSKTGGSSFSKYSSPNPDDPIDLAIPAMHRQLITNDWYRSTFKLTARENTFTLFSWFRLYMPMYYYNAKADEVWIYYE